MMQVYSVSKSPTHSMEKYLENEIRLVTNLGVEGDAHSGETVQHLSRLKLFGSKPNLRQVHLIHRELLTELQTQGFEVKPGQMGENILTEGINLLKLPQNTTLHIGQDVIIRITGLRNPCKQLNGIKTGLMKAVLDRDNNGKLIRKAGVMAVVVSGGRVKIGDAIKIQLPEKPNLPLEPV